MDAQPYHDDEEETEGDQCEQCHEKDGQAVAAPDVAKVDRRVALIRRRVLRMTIALHPAASASISTSVPGYTHHILKLGPRDKGARADRRLAEHLKDKGITRTRLQQLMSEGLVTLNGRPLDQPARRLPAAGEVIVSVPPPADAVPQPEAIPLDIVYEDAHLIVIDKPAGLVVHPAPGHGTGTLVHALLHHCGDSLSGIGGVLRPGIVHRLDKDTTGLLVVAKGDEAHWRLQRMFAKHDIERVYTAFVLGVPEPPKGRVKAPIARHPRHRVKMAVVPGGKPAVTDYAVEEVFHRADGKPVAARVRCVLHTGRTHQVRVHMAHLGHPLIGDPLYGGRRRRPRGDKHLEAVAAFPRQALHACVLGFTHPITGRDLRFESALPADLADLAGMLAGEGTLA